MRRTIEQAEQLAAKLRALPAAENKKREISKQEEIRLPLMAASPCAWIKSVAFNRWLAARSQAGR